MSLQFSKNVSSEIEFEIRKERRRYDEALKADAQFHVLKCIREKIRILENKLKEKETQHNGGMEMQD